MQKTKYKGLYKVHEGVVLNHDNEALAEYKLRKTRFLEEKKRINQMEADVNQVKNDLQEIKDLLKGLAK